MRVDAAEELGVTRIPAAGCSARNPDVGRETTVNKIYNTRYNGIAMGLSPQRGETE